MRHPNIHLTPTLALALAACGPGPNGEPATTDELGPDVAFSSEAPERGRSQEQPAPVLAAIALDEDVTVEFIATSDDSIGIAFGGPFGAKAVDAVGTSIQSAESPLALYLALRRDGTPPPAELVRHSEAVVAAGNWSGCAAKKPAPEKQLQEISTPVASPSTLQIGTHQSALTCDYLHAWGDNLPGNYGDCTLYFRDHDEVTHWTLDDLVAFAGHVISQNHSTYWEVRHRNCNAGCNWSLDYVKSIQEGYHYYFYTYDVNDDFKGDSIVWSNADGGSHYHDIARIHDYFHRVINTSYGNQSHGIRYNGSSLFCTDAYYQGPDPSNIATGDWEGYNGGDC